MITVSTPGKIHLLGEHVVVYGNPALMATIDKRCVVQLIPSKNNEVKIIAENMQRTITLSVTEIHKQTEIAHKRWLQYQSTNDSVLLASITQDAVSYPIIAIGETLRYFKIKNVPGFTLKIRSEIPIGAGLGSSAALAVSIVTLLAAFLQKKISKSVINEIAFLIEQKKHGTPSGGDNTVVTFGGFVWFQKEKNISDDIQQIDPAVVTQLAKNVILIDTGKPQESTGEMVGLVRKLKMDKPRIVASILKAQESLTHEFLSAIKQNEEAMLLRIIRAAERNLERLGVVSAVTKDVIRDIEKAGGAAKISGAGGRAQGSGIIFAMHSEKILLEKLAQKRKMPYYNIVLGSEGARIQ
jgi:mevalonate kinase